MSQDSLVVDQASDTTPHADGGGGGGGRSSHSPSYVITLRLLAYFINHKCEKTTTAAATKAKRKEVEAQTPSYVFQPWPKKRG